MSRTVGVIGGMGPEATVDFLRRIVAATPAKDDQDHIRILVDNNPKIPSRLDHLFKGTGEDPLPVLIRMARGLEAQGADFLTIPCNTAHHYLPKIAEAVRIPVLDMVALAMAKVGQARIGMLASPALKKVGLYKGALFPDDDETILNVIRAVKAGNVTAQHRRDYAAVAASLDVDAYLIACTELSVLGPPDGTTKPVADALDVLVAETVARALATSGDEPGAFPEINGAGETRIR